MGWREDVKFGIVRVSRLFVGDGNGGLGTEFDIDELLELIGESALTFVQGDPPVAVGHGIEDDTHWLTNTDTQVIEGKINGEVWLQITEGQQNFGSENFAHFQITQDGPGNEAFDFNTSNDTVLQLTDDLIIVGPATANERMEIDHDNGKVKVFANGNAEFTLDASGLTLKAGASVNEIETTLTDDDTHLPTSGAVVDAISAIPSPPEDKIFEGDSKVEVIDTGTGQISMEVDGSPRASLTSNDQTIGVQGLGGTYVNQSQSGKRILMEADAAGSQSARLDLNGNTGRVLVQAGGNPTIELNNATGVVKNSNGNSWIELVVLGGVYSYDVTLNSTQFLYIDENASSINLSNGNVFIDTIKSGATQAAAGAAANEVWKTNGHATLPDNVLMIGV